LATVIVYGLFFATIITLYVLPAIFYLVEKKWCNKNSWEVQEEMISEGSSK
jgi:cobalt-zinc-cadmium resistance protein CzcA